MKPDTHVRCTECGETRFKNEPCKTCAWYNEISEPWPPSPERGSTLTAYIQRQGLQHDYGDLLEHGVEEVLDWYGLSLCEDSRQETVVVLVELGGELQTAEMFRLTQAPDTLLAQVDARDWTLKEIQAFNKWFLKKLRERRERYHRETRFLGSPSLVCVPSVSDRADY